MSLWNVALTCAHSFQRVERTLCLVQAGPTPHVVQVPRQLLLAEGGKHFPELDDCLVFERLRTEILVSGDALQFLQINLVLGEYSYALDSDYARLQLCWCDQRIDKVRKQCSEPFAHGSKWLQ